MHVCTACMIVSLLTTCLNLNTSPLAQVAPFRCKSRESNAEVPLDTKTQQARLPADSGLYNTTFPSRVSKRSPRLVYKHHGPDKVSALSIILAHHWALKSSAPSRAIQSVHEISIACCSCFPPFSCSLLLLCSL